MKHSIPWGKQDELTFDLPATWNLLGRMTPAQEPPVESVDAELESALSQPAGAPPLRELAKGKARVAVIVDDISRPTPAHLLLGKILDHLEAGGVDLGQTVVLPGLGIHRAMTQEEMEQKAGAENLLRTTWENPNCRDHNTLAALGATRRGTKVHVNKKVAAADLVVLVGTIEPHLHAGFGGGYKNVLPGVAGIDTIAQNHSICAHPKRYNIVGSEPENNPMRLDIEEAGAMLPGEVFLVNTILNPDKDIVRIVAGDPVAAHRQGVRTARRIHGVDIPRPADVVITGSFPMDLDMRQGAKALANVFPAVKPGGIIIGALKCDEGLGEVKVPEKELKSSDFKLKLIVRMLSAVLRHYAPSRISQEERFFVYSFLRSALRANIYVYAPSVTERLKGRVPLINVFDTLDSAIADAAQRNPGADVLIFPKGAITYPVIS